MHKVLKFPHLNCQKKICMFSHAIKNANVSLVLRFGIRITRVYAYISKALIRFLVTELSVELSQPYTRIGKT